MQGIIILTITGFVMGVILVSLNDLFKKNKSDDFLKLLQEFVAEYETTILLSTHLQEDLSKIADYIIEIHDGNYKMREAEV